MECEAELTYGISTFEKKKSQMKEEGTEDDGMRNVRMKDEDEG